MHALAQHDKVLCKNCRLEFDFDALFCPNCGTAKSRDMGRDPLVGATVGDRYQLTQQIGQGTSGSIYLAEHTTLGRKVVVKVLHHELGRDDLAIERFRREATTVGALDNDHIVQIFDFGRTPDGRLYLAMEHLEGETLADRIEQKGRIETEEAVDILTQLGEALIEAHATGYVHRDLRPRNLFLAVRRTRANYLKLLDFGLAKLVEQEGEAASTSLGMTFGDPHYMSPEQAKGLPVDRRADIYSMGCIAYEMLTGQPPFTGEKVFDVLTMHVKDKPRSLTELAPNTPPWLERAVMRCLEKNAEDRYITVYRFVEALRSGSDSGIIMTDDKARRRPTEEPPSISQAMERLAARSAELEGPLPPLAGSIEAAPSHVDTADTEKVSEPSVVTAGAGQTTKKPLGAETVMGLGSLSSDSKKSDASTTKRERLARASEPPSLSPMEAAATLPAPETLPIDSGPVDSAPVARGKVEAAVDRNAESSAGLSAVWYADGDTDGASALSEKDRAKLDRARGRSASSTGVLNAAEGDFYEDEFVDRGKRNLVIAGLGAVGVLGLLVVLFSLGGGDDKKDEEGKKVAEAAVDPAEKEAATDTPDPVEKDPTELPAETGADAGADVEATDPPEGLPKEDASKEPKVSDPKETSKVRTQKERRPKVRNSGPPKPEDFLPNPGGNSRPPVNPIDVSSKPLPNTDVRSNGNRDNGTNTAGGPSAAAKAEASTLAGQGASDLRNGDILGAAAKFNKARSLDPTNSQAVAGLGEIALGQGAYSAAIGHLRKASKMRSGNAQIWTLLGEAYLGNGDRSKAEDAFKRALKLRPDNARAREGYNEATGN